MADRYRLLKDINYPGCYVKAETIGFRIRERDYYSFSGVGTDYCIDANYIDKNPDWFEKIEEKLYTEEDMRKAYEGGMTYGMMSCQTRVDPSFNFFKWLENYIRSKSLTNN